MLRKKSKKVKPRSFLEITNNEARRELVDGRRITTLRVDFNIIMFIGSAYLMAYFFLIGFVSLILSNGKV